MITYRLFNSEDSYNLIQFYYKEFPNAYTDFPKWWIKKESSIGEYYSTVGKDNNTIFLALDNKKIVGVLPLAHQKDKFDNLIGVIGHFLVSDNYRSKGIGTHLFKQAIDYAISKNYSSLTLLVFKKHSILVGFYLKQGFYTEIELLEPDLKLMLCVMVKKLNG
ncbi:GNAT family N-acetyltransferase [Candidatus Micrarchaeota archaeon]|jgi:GNAT superfamily N-acetyltransferase|nr:GNAT family N-acetyltransferase [Candidatus Micrarchaeota archaeon]